MRPIPLYQAEIDDGLADAVRASGCLVLASAPTPITSPANGPGKNLSLPAGAKASQGDSDLYWLRSILVSTGWNLNDDVFDPEETWAARRTPTEKQFNNDHDCAQIIGHITLCVPLDRSGQAVADDAPLEDVPDSYDLSADSVLYRYWEKEDLQKKMDGLLDLIARGKKFVSMECYFSGFDYALLAKDGAQKVVARNSKTAFLTKYLRAYGGGGTYQGDRVGRLLRDITFSGIGLVDNPANPRSEITNHSAAVAAGEAAVGRSAAFRAATALVYQPANDPQKETNDVADTNIEKLTAERDAAVTKAGAAEARVAVVEAKASALETQVAEFTAKLAEANGLTATANQTALKAEKAFRAEIEALKAELAQSKESFSTANTELAQTSKEVTRLTRAATIADKLTWTLNEAGAYAGTTLGLTQEQFDQQLEMVVKKLAAKTPAPAPAKAAETPPPAKVTAEETLNKVEADKKPIPAVAVNQETDAFRQEMFNHFAPAKKAETETK